MSEQKIVERLRSSGCVFAEQEAALLIGAATSRDQLEEFVRLRVRGLPLEHVVGWADFGAVRVLLDPGVFVPRPRSVHLVETAAEFAHGGALVLDLCCGSGAIGLALSARVAGIELVACDRDPIAVLTARRNLEPIEASVFEGDLFAALPTNLRGRFELITVVAPYVPTQALRLLPHEARDFEPRTALDGGEDGLHLVGRIISESSGWLAPGGRLVGEISEDQLPTALGLIRDAGLAAAHSSNDESDSHVMIATMPAVTTG